MEMRRKALDLGVSQISGGSRTAVGGYIKDIESESAQFDVSDKKVITRSGQLAIRTRTHTKFCTACYREGRTGDRFMSLLKSGQIVNCCHPNALITLEEYMCDYGNEKDT